MRQILFEIFGVSIPSWYLLFFVSMVSLYLTALSLLKRVQNPKMEGELPLLFSLSYIAGWLGARLLSIVVEEPEPLRGVTDLLSRLFSFGGMTLYGGALTASITLFVTVALLRLPARIIFDISMTSSLVALGFGRLGCFLNGCDFGKPVAISEGGAPWWAHTVTSLHDNVHRFPTQLEESLVSFLLALLGVVLFKRFVVSRNRRSLPGVTGASLLLISAANRFGNEIFRADARGFFPGTSLSTSQGIALLLMVLAFGLMLFWTRRGQST